MATETVRPRAEPCNRPHGDLEPAESNIEIVKELRAALMSVVRQSPSPAYFDDDARSSCKRLSTLAWRRRRFLLLRESDQVVHDGASNLISKPAWFQKFMDPASCAWTDATRRVPADRSRLRRSAAGPRAA